jgi:signal peptide peptidase SppA
MDTIDLERLFAGRTLALDRASLPALAARASARVGAASLEQVAQQRAALLDDRNSQGLTVRRVGSVAIVPLSGLITSDPLWIWIFGGTSPDALVRALQQAVADPEVTSIVLLVDSPGGEVSLLTETAAEIRRLKVIKPITSIARTQMASAAFWLGAQATTVVATPSADIGGVGVFTVFFDTTAFDARIGIVPEYIASTPEKIEAVPGAPLGDPARVFLHSRVNEVYGTFVADLAKGRNITPARVRSDFGAGRSFGAVEAVQRGLADRMVTLEGLLAKSGARSSLQSQADADAIGIMVALSGDETGTLQNDRDWLLLQ